MGRQALYSMVSTYRDVLYTARDLPAHPEEFHLEQNQAQPTATSRDDIMDAYLLHILQVITTVLFVSPALLRSLGFRTRVYEGLMQGFLRRVQWGFYGG